MKLSCSQQELVQGLKIVNRAAATRTTLPVLDNVLLATTDGFLKLSATNLEISLTCQIEAKVENGGAITVPAHTLVDLVSSLPADKIDMELVEHTQTLKLECARQKANVKGLDAQEFPIIPTIDAQEAVELPTDVFSNAIKRTIISASSDESRPVLKGVLMSLADNQLTLSAADGFRLSVATAQIQTDRAISVIVPATALGELMRRIQEKPIQMVLREQQALFQTGDILLVAQLIEGKFPDFEQIVPKEYTTKTMVDTQALQRGCKTASIFAESSLINLLIGEDSIILTSTDAELGDSTNVIDAQVEGPEISLGLNVTYLLDVLNVIGCEKIALETTTPSCPVVVKPVGEVGFIHVIMPMHIRGKE